MKSRSEPLLPRLLSPLLLSLALALLPVAADAGSGAGGLVPPERRIAWDPGLPDGVPRRKGIGANVKEEPYGAKGDGRTDDSDAFQEALDRCPEGRVVYVPEGTYRLDRPLRITRPVVLRGAGPGKSRLRFFGTGEKLPGSGSWITVGPAAPRHGPLIPVTKDHEKGSGRIVLEDVTGFSEGDFGVVSRENGGEVTNVGSQGICTWCGRDGRALGQMFRVTSVDPARRAIEISPPLHAPYPEAVEPVVWKIGPVLRNAGIEDLYVEEVSGHTEGKHTILLSAAAHCWLKNVELSNATRMHVTILYGFRNEIRDGFFHGTQAYLPNHYSLLLGSCSTANLVENNVFYDGAVHVLAAWGATGNVIAYNHLEGCRDERSSTMMPDAAAHGAHPSMNLFEGNVMGKVQADFVWGSSSAATFYRNLIHREDRDGELKGALWVVDLQKRQYHYNFLGNVLGHPGMRGEYEIEGADTTYDSPAVFRLGYVRTGDRDAEGNDPRVAATLLRHGNFDYVTGKVVWDREIRSRKLPPSLYLPSKPDFFGDADWPAIGPDLRPMVGTLPATARFRAFEKSVAERPAGHRED